MDSEVKKGIVKIVFFIVIMIAAGYLAAVFLLKKQEQTTFSAPTVNPQAGLGAEGALCGGDKRLPCMPGNKCQITNEETNEGVCVHVTDDPGKAQPPTSSNNQTSNSNNQ